MDQRDDATATAEPRRSAQQYCEALKKAESKFAEWQRVCDNVDKQLGDLERLSHETGDRELQVFWANTEVMKPAVYARPPVPAVSPKFRAQKPILRETSEVLERSIAATFDAVDIDTVMTALRDDVVVAARGVPWVRYVAQGETQDDFVERVAIEHVDRQDFLHEPARTWSEVGWVARLSYLTREEGLARFGDAALNLPYEKHDEIETDIQKAAVWEVWDRVERVVVWVAHGVDGFLDVREPWLNLDGFFPCPRPAYATIQRGSLIPLPDFLFYRDQISEINELTERVSALSESLRMRGFAPGGGGDLAEAVNTALATMDDRAVLVPVSNFAAFGGASLRDSIVWLPLDQVANTIQTCLLLRRQIIDDVYQVTGISDILRGSTDPNETLGAQQLKSQWGSIRIRSRQAELVRIARDLARMTGEIIAEQFQPETLALLSQTELPRAADIQMQVQQLGQQMQAAQIQAQQMMADPRAQQMAAQNPEQAQQMAGQAEQQMQAMQGQMAQLQETVTLEAVHELLANERLRPFMLDVETDSTIQPDEDAEKQRRTEFLTAMMGFLQQAVPAVKEVPQLSELAAEALKFTAGGFRAGRQLEDVIDRFAEQMKQMGGAGSGEQQDPEKAAKAQQITQDMQIEAQKAQIEMQKMQQEIQIAAETARVEIEKTQAETARIVHQMNQPPRAPERVQ